MKCRYCKSNSCIKRGKRGVKQRLFCKRCKKYQQNYYTYKLYNTTADKLLLVLNANGVGISGMARISKYRKNTIIRQLVKMAEKENKPVLFERNQVYEVDELWTYIGSKKNEVYISYAINRRTKQVVDFVVGRRTKEVLNTLIEKIKLLSPKKIVTDKYNAYPSIVKPCFHDTTIYRNNRIERGNLNLREHIKRLNRKTISFSKSVKMLEVTMLLYFKWNNWSLHQKSFTV